MQPELDALHGAKRAAPRHRTARRTSNKKATAADPSRSIQRRPKRRPIMDRNNGGRAWYERENDVRTPRRRHSHDRTSMDSWRYSGMPVHTVPATRGRFPAYLHVWEGGELRNRLGPTDHTAWMKFAGSYLQAMPQAYGRDGNKTMQHYTLTHTLLQHNINIMVETIRN